jgi:Na+-translocating ferredoxin:NAD+ oxidoreductase RnfD subunit
MWLTHAGVDVSHFVAMHILGAVFPVSAGLLLYGWRAVAVIVVVAVSTVLAVQLWRRVGRRGAPLRLDHALWLSLILSLTLPAHLFAWNDRANFTSMVPWPILPAAGVTLAGFIWVLGGPGAGRIHPVLVTQLLLFVLFRQLLVPHVTLQMADLFRGDVLNAPRDVANPKQPWTQLASDPNYDAVRAEPASQRLIFYTSGNESPDRTWLSLDSLLRDRMPPLEDLIIGGQPGPIGTSSAIAVIIGGLFLLYRGLIDFRVPLLIVLTAYLSLLILPIPAYLTESAGEFRWLAWRAPPHGVGWELALTLAHYELMASPLLFTAFFLATAPSVRPMARRARAIYAILTGILAAAFQLYIAVSIGPYLALLATSLLTPTLDKVFRPRTLV